MGREQARQIESSICLREQVVGVCVSCNRKLLTTSSIMIIAYLFLNVVPFYMIHFTVTCTKSIILHDNSDNYMERERFVLLYRSIKNQNGSRLHLMT